MTRITCSFPPARPGPSTRSTTRRVRSCGVRSEESFIKPYDYFHINSIDVYDEDHLLISSRTTWTVYKVDHKTGEIVWRQIGRVLYQALRLLPHQLHRRL